jgi:hypothetical protein
VINRRTAPILLLAGILASANLVSLARAEPATPGRTAGPSVRTNIPPCSGNTDNRTVTNLTDVLSCIAPYSDAPTSTKYHYQATLELINFIDRIDRCTPSHPISSSELLDMLTKIKDINEKVNTALGTPKDSDYWVLDRDDPPSVLLRYKNRIISPAVKSKKMSESDLAVKQIIAILSPYLARQGLNVSESGPVYGPNLHHLAEIVLNLGNDLFEWGMDAYLAPARGYAIYQFVHNCAVSRRASLKIARTYAVRTAAQSEQYFSMQIEKLASLRPPRPKLRRWENDKLLIEGGIGAGGGFPKDIYLGTNVPANTSFGRPGSECARNDPNKSVENWYGKLKYDDKIWASWPAPPLTGFSLDSVRSDCAANINTLNLGAINTLMTKRLEGLGPTADLDQTSAELRIQLISNAINNHISRITFEMLTEKCLLEPTSPCPALPSGDSASAENIVRQIRSEIPIVTAEFNALGATARAIRDILALRPQGEALYR